MLKFCRVLVILFSAFLLCANWGVHRSPPGGSSEAREDALAQLVYLEDQVHAGLGERLQAWFPEGNAFTHVLYGLAWCGYGHIASDPVDTQHAIAEAEWAYRQLDSPGLKGLFPTVMEPKYGAFYSGWRNYLLGRIIELSGPMVSPRLVDEFDAQSAELRRAYSGSDSPFLPSYDGMAWPGDNVVAIASLAMHQRLRMDSDDVVIDRWLRQATERLDEDGSLPHAWDPINDRMVQAARGSSQSLMNCFLPVIDSAFATDQFVRYRERFLDSRLGVPMVREFAKGSVGTGDVDSGPIIFGAGSSATVVGPGAFRLNGDPVHADELDASIEGFGMPVGGASKLYVFGLMPIADLFIVWTRTMGERVMTEPQRPSFMAFHLWSLLVAALLWLPMVFAGWKKRRARDSQGAAAH